MDLYQVFQSSYNKITKSESRPASEGYGGTDIYQPESRFFPFDTKQEKTEAGDTRHWPGFSGDMVTGHTRPMVTPGQSPNQVTGHNGQ